MKSTLHDMRTTLYDIRTTLLDNGCAMIKSLCNISPFLTQNMTIKSGKRIASYATAPDEQTIEANGLERAQRLVRIGCVKPVHFSLLLIS